MIPQKYTNDTPKAILVSDGGVNGADYIDDTAAHTGQWTEILGCAAAVGALVATNVGGTLSAVTIPVGAVLRGNFTSITLASGKVWATRQ